MPTWSKLASDASCKEIVHPWTDSCLLGAAQTFAASCVGAAGFFSILYFCQYVSTVLKKKKKKPSFGDYLKTHLRSTVFGASVAATTVSLSCLLRNLLGKYYCYSIVFIPASLGGCFIFLERRKGREIFTNAFSNCALELFLRHLEDTNFLKWTPNSQTVVFMVLSSILSSLLSGVPIDRQYLWFFQPPKVNDKTEKVCFHDGDCWKHILNLFVMYSSTGFILQFLRVFGANIKRPKLIMSSVTRLKNFKFAAFLGGYVVVYQALRCFLYQKERKYSREHDAIAGFFAGTTFRFQPNFTIFNSAILNIIQILTESGCDRKILPNIPYLEMAFAVSCGILFHARFFMSEKCPHLMVYIMSSVTHRKVDEFCINYESVLSNLMKTKTH